MLEYGRFIIRGSLEIHGCDFVILMGLPLYEVLTYHLKVEKINILFRGSRPYHFRGKLDMINVCCFLCTYWLTSYGWWLYAYSDKSTLVENAPWLNVMWPCDTSAFITRMSYISTDEKNANNFTKPLAKLKLCTPEVKLIWPFCKCIY